MKNLVSPSIIRNLIYLVTHHFKIKDMIYSTIDRCDTPLDLMCRKLAEIIDSTMRYVDSQNLNVTRIFSDIALNELNKLMEDESKYEEDSESKLTSHIFLKNKLRLLKP